MLKRPVKPLTAKDYEEEVIGICCGCGCSCVYVVYKKENQMVDLYGHPADIRGMGSLCSKGIAYIQETQTNPIRLKGFYLREDNSFKSISYTEAKELLKKVLRGRVAFLLDRHTSLEDYLLAESLGDVFVSAPVVNFKPSSVDFWDWKDYRLILSVDAEPVFSEVMSARYVVDAVEKSAILICISSRFETLCTKAKRRFLTDPTGMVTLLEKVIHMDSTEEEAVFLRKALYTMRSSLVLMGAHLLASPYRNRFLNILQQLRKRFSVDYSLVGDIMPFPAKELKDFSPEDYDALVVMGNPFKLLPREKLKLIKDKPVVHFTFYPNYTSHMATLIIGSKHFTEREFINYRHGFSRTFCSPKVLNGEGFYTLAELLDAELDLSEYADRELELPYIEEVHIGKAEELLRGVWIHTENTLLEDLGHWYAWLHEMERYQKAYMNKNTARLFRDGFLRLGDAELPVEITPKIADNVVFVPKSFEEYQPYYGGFSPNAFMREPYMSYEVLR